ncbi:MAG: relaxase/mobilization nuclease domain-containing protein [Pseudomonadota bacterium]
MLDIASYGRRGPGEAGSRLTPAQVEYIRRTVGRTPEAVVKVLPRNSNDLKAAAKHLDYIGRHGELALEDDHGENLQGQYGKTITEAWDLDIDDVRRQTNLASASGRKPPKLIHKLMFSMPPGTPPAKVLGAVRNFAREEFWGQHRYAFVLHTDEAHPHVHLVLRAVSEQGVRLNIKKATLRRWRSEFARNLRLLGVEANATERAVRGESRKARKDGIYRAARRGDSTHVRAQAQVVAGELLKGDVRAESGKKTLLDTRREVVRGWHGVADHLVESGQHDLAAKVWNFVGRLPSPNTDREAMADKLRTQLRVASTREQEYTQ